VKYTWTGLFAAAYTSGAVIHDAFFYSSDDEFAGGLAPFLAEAVAAGQGAIAVTTPARIEILRARLGADAAGVSFVDSSSWYRRPGTTLAAWRDVLDQHAREGIELVRAVGEIPFPAEEAAALRWARYESVLADAIGERPAWIVCPYNLDTAAAEIATAARVLHPMVMTGEVRVPSQEARDPRQLRPMLARAEERPNARDLALVEVSDIRDLEVVRQSVRWPAHGVGLEADVVDDLLLAIAEIAQTSLAARTTKVTVHVRSDGDEWFCELVTAPGTSETSFGVQVAQVIADRVEIAEHPDRSVVRILFGTARADARRRIVAAAFELFRAGGVRSTGINAVIERAAVAKATFYAHFRSKDELVRLWLMSPAARWFDQVRAELETRSDSPLERLVAFFDVLGEWLAADGFRGCPLINTAAEFHRPDHWSRQALAELGLEIESYFQRTAAEAGLADDARVAARLFLLVPGTIITASARASTEPAETARTVAAELVAGVRRA
jgi:AcrR family transcriptional regulator